MGGVRPAENFSEPTALLVFGYLRSGQGPGLWDGASLLRTSS